MKFAVISDNTVTNIIVADTLEIAEAVTSSKCIEYTDERPVGIGYIYDSVRDVILLPSPFPSWILNEDTYNWEAPVIMPVEQGKHFIWNEDLLNWDSHDLLV
jgi:hypothetical protein